MFSLFSVLDFIGNALLYLYFQGWIDNFNGPSGIFIAVSVTLVSFCVKLLQPY